MTLSGCGWRASTGAGLPEQLELTFVPHAAADYDILPCPARKAAVTTISHD